MHIWQNHCIPLKWIHQGLDSFLEGISILLISKVFIYFIYSAHMHFQGEEFVKLLNGSSVPHTRHVVGSNYCFMNVFEDRIPGRAIIISVVCVFNHLYAHCQTSFFRLKDAKFLFSCSSTPQIDNLVKGASGQAVQNLNLMMGLPENRGLQYQPLFPWSFASVRFHFIRNSVKMVLLSSLSHVIIGVWKNQACSNALLSLCCCFCRD